MTRRIAVGLCQIGVVAALYALWQWATASGRVSPLLLPAPAPVFREFAALLQSGGYWTDLAVTMGEWLAAFAIASVIALPLGYLISRSAFAVRVFDPLLAGLYSVPAILLFPLYVLFFGLGSGSKVAIGATIAFFPVILNTIAGLAHVERSYITAARSMGASQVQLFWCVMLPAAFPVVLTGLRMGLILTFIAVLGAEAISALAGLGHRIVYFSENMEQAKMFSFIVFAVLMAFLLNVAVTMIEVRARRSGQP